MNEKEHQKINIEIYRNKDKEVYGFRADNHGEPIVCSAVSALTINTVNSIQTFTEEEINLDVGKDGGYMFFEITNVKNGGSNEKTQLLMNSLVLGLKSIEENYGEHIVIID